MFAPSPVTEDTIGNGASAWVCRLSLVGQRRGSSFSSSFCDPAFRVRIGVDATIALLREPEIKIEKLLKIVKGPDFPTGGFICGREEIRKSYLEGRGNGIHWCEFLPDGRLLTFSRRDNAVKLWPASCFRRGADRQ